MVRKPGRPAGGVASPRMMEFATWIGSTELRSRCDRHTPRHRRTSRVRPGGGSATGAADLVQFPDPRWGRGLDRVVGGGAADRRDGRGEQLRAGPELRGVGSGAAGGTGGPVDAPVRPPARPGG